MYWICGWFDLSNTCELSQTQWEMVQRHFDLMLAVSNNCPSLVAINLENEKDNPEQLSYLCHSQISGERPSEAEIMYYIQGFYEISGVGSDYKLNKEQINQISELFILNNTGVSPKGIDIFINIVQNTDQVKQKLNDIFEHAIDLSYGLNEEELAATQRIHDG